MSLINFIIILFGILFSKELIAANEERIIVSSLVLVLVLGLEFLSDTIKDELNNSVMVIYDEIKYYMVIYYGIVKAFEKLCIQRNIFLTAFFQGTLIYLTSIKYLINNYISLIEHYIIMLEYYIIWFQIQKL